MLHDYGDEVVLEVDGQTVVAPEGELWLKFLTGSSLTWPTSVITRRWGRYKPAIPVWSSLTGPCSGV